MEVMLDLNNPSLQATHHDKYNWIQKPTDDTPELIAPKGENPRRT